MVAQFGIASLPTVIFFRLMDTTAINHVGDRSRPSTGIQEIGRIVGGGPQFLTEFAKLLERNSTTRERDTLRRFREMCPADAAEVENTLNNIASSVDDVVALCSRPLRSCASFVCERTRDQLSLPLVSSNLAFDVSAHNAAQTAPAQSVLQRFRDDVVAHADAANVSLAVKLDHITDADVNAFFRGEAQAKFVLTRGLLGLRELLKSLKRQRADDEQMLSDTVPMMMAAVNWIEPDRNPLATAAETSTVPSSERNNKLRFILSRFSRQRPLVWPEFLFGALLSSQGEDDLRRLNPFLMTDRIAILLNMVTLSMLRANRLGLINRCVGSVVALESLLTKVLAVAPEQRGVQGAVLAPKLVQAAGDLASIVTMGRHYMTACDTGGFEYDPRYLVFEFVWNIQLRKKQVEIVNDFRECLHHGKSKVKQMIMGAGKTSVVAPLMALILANGNSLVLSVVPKALVEMSRTRMRETFATIMVKRIYTLEFDRSTTVTAAMRRGLENATANRGVVVVTPTTLKSVMLCYVEMLQRIKEAKQSGMKSKLPELETQATELSKILTLFRDGTMLLDEVDLILHPLKSELNFPIGEKFDLDGAEDGERWNLPIHLFDAFFYASQGKTSSDTDRQGGQALELLKSISLAVQRGIEQCHLQRLPHITLLNVDYYEETLKPLLAEWAYLWLLKNHLHGIDKSEAIRYLLEGAAARSAASNKVHALELALGRAQVDAGIRSPMTRPTHGFTRSLSVMALSRQSSGGGGSIAEMSGDDAAEAAAALVSTGGASDEQDAHGASAILSAVVGTPCPPTLRQPSVGGVSTPLVSLSRATSDDNSGRNPIFNAQVQRLQEALSSAMEQRDLINKIYDLDEQLEMQARSGGRAIAELTGEIVTLQKAIADIECPRDDSLDNSVVVWCSQAFAPVAPSSTAVVDAAALTSITAAPSSNAGDNAVTSICVRLEDLGLTVRRCSDPEEAVARARDLQEEGHLRCLVVGGEEKGTSCGPTCTADHGNKLCVLCNMAFRKHSGHSCRSTWKRGSFPLDDERGAGGGKINSVQILTSLLDKESAFARSRPAVGALPANRGCVYAAHSDMKEDVRMSFWNMGVGVFGESKQLVSVSCLITAFICVHCFDGLDNRWSGSKHCLLGRLRLLRMH